MRLLGKVIPSPFLRKLRAMINAMTIDVEDWFHILDLKNGYKLEDYGQLESRVERNTEALLSILRDYNVKGTFFVVGWVAETFPDVVREIHAQGHEVASHGYAHSLCYEMSPEEFKEDTDKSIQILEALTGEKVLGYRAPGTSIMRQNLWALDILIDLGIAYDTSIYPGVRGHGGLPGAPRYPYHQLTPSGRKIFEIPSSCFDFFGKKIGFAGGGYLRLFPYPLIRRGINQYNKQGHPVNVYIHPREIDPDHPRVKMPVWRRFKSYVNLHTTEKKLRSLLRDYRFGKIRDIFDFG
jgi:polysaccharide deacetylase family protein (PEP-CTERM system associated)